MTVKEIIDNWPIGYRAGLPTLVVKKTKKKTQVGTKWYQQLVLTDGTADILVDVKLEGNVGLTRNQEIRGIIAEVQNGEAGKKLLIEQYQLPSQSEPYDREMEDWQAKNEKEIKSKIRCWLVAAAIQNGATMQPTENSKNWINTWVEFVYTGK